MDNGKLFVGVVTYVTFASVLTCTEAQGSTSGFVDQWVSQVTAFSSQFISAIPPYTKYPASLVIGPPDNNGTLHGGTWLPLVTDAYQFLELKYREKVYVTSVDVYGTDYAGETTAILAEDERGNWISLWNATQFQCVHSGRIFSPILKKFRFMTDHIRIEGNSTICVGYHNAIDAVKLEGRCQPPGDQPMHLHVQFRSPKHKPQFAITASVKAAIPNVAAMNRATESVPATRCTPVTQSTSASTVEYPTKTAGSTSGSTVEYPTTTAGWTSGSSPASLTCFQCDDVSHLELCDNIETCGQNEVCYMEGYTNAAGHKLYKSGCKDAVRCETERSNADPATACVRCCSTSFCNSVGCGDSGFPAAGYRGPVCYDCQYVRSVEECHTVAVCQPGQVCSIEEYPLGDHSHFKMGCVQESCHLMRRSVPRCHNCCREDFCNVNCTAQPDVGVSPVG